MRLNFVLMDCGAKVGVGIQIGDWRRGWRFRNPLWMFINWRWQRRKRAEKQFEAVELARRTKGLSFDEYIKGDWKETPTK